MTLNKTPLRYARTESGRVNTDAYIGLDGNINTNSLIVNVNIIGARIRYGHLDLQVVPKNGAGNVWVERKNINILEDPAAERTEVLTYSDSPPQVGNFTSDIKEMIRKMITEEQTKVTTLTGN